MTSLRKKYFYPIAGFSLLAALSVISTADAAPSPATKLGMPIAAPESQGFSTEGLKALNAEFHGLVDSQKLAGVTTLIARHGKIVHFDTYGKANAATGAALKPDSIYRIDDQTHRWRCNDATLRTRKMET